MSGDDDAPAAASTISKCAVIWSYSARGKGKGWSGDLKEFGAERRSRRRSGTWYL